MPAHFQIKHQDYLQGQAWHVLQNKNNIKYYVHSAHDVYLQTAKKETSAITFSCHLSTSAYSK